MDTDSSEQQGTGSSSIAVAAHGPVAGDAGQISSGFFEVQLEQFDGPIDLLLHLVKQNELPIEKIALAQVATQYLKCIEEMRYFDLDLAGEYLVIAATLVSIKSSVLLNEPVELVEDGLGNLVNPHDELLRRLKEAAIYRDGALALRNLNLLGVDVFPSQVGLEGVTAPPVRYRAQEVAVLARAFQRIVRKIEAQQPGFTVMIEHVSIVERMRSLLERLNEAKGRLSFYDLLVGSQTSVEPPTRGSLVGTFVAVLELCKRQILTVIQGEDFEDIFVCLASLSTEGGETEKFNVAGASLSSEFDRNEIDGSEENSSEVDEASEVANH